MSDATLPRPDWRNSLAAIWREQRVWIASALILLALAIFDPAQARSSALFAAPLTLIVFLSPTSSDGISSSGRVVGPGG